MSKNHRSFYRGSSAYRRGVPRFPPSGKAFLIVTEGEKTEPNYMDALRKRLQLNATDVKIVHPPGTDPVTLTKHAIALRDARKKSAEKSYTVLPYDEVWVIFDLEKEHDQRRELAKRAMRLEEAAGIQFAISDPCFEYWLLLHHDYTTRPFPECDAVIKLLNKHMPGYSKGMKPESSIFDKLPAAVRHAMRCRKHHETSGGNGNPSTKVDFLVANLNAATRPHLRFPL